MEARIYLLNFLELPIAYFSSLKPPVLLFLHTELWTEQEAFLTQTDCSCIAHFVLCTIQGIESVFKNNFP